MSEENEPMPSAAVGIPPASRQELIDKAVHFLQDPKVNQTPLNYQKAFLQKKGLTDSEIDEAFRKVPNVGQRSIVPSGAQSYPAYPQYPPLPPQRASWRDYANGLVLVGGATYMTVNFVKNYVLPRFFGVPTAQQQQFNVIQENLVEVQNGLKFLVDSVQQTVTMVQQQQEISNKLLQQLAAKEDSSRGLEKAVAELKSEMNVVKSLLLSRDQFPPLPQIKNHSLPAWQQSNGTNETPKKIFENGDSLASEGSPV